MVTVIVVNWNGGELLQGVLRSLEAQTLKPARILILDNGSDDGSAQEAEGSFDVTLRYLGSNRGFAAANNLGIAACDTEFVALLNPDALPQRDWLENLVKAAGEHPAISAFGSLQLSSASRDVVDGIGDVYHLSGLAWRRGYRRRLDGVSLAVGEIFSACACAVLYRRDALQRVGGFDEDFFCYMEDVDLGFRLRLAGYRAAYVPSAVVYHVGSATTGGSRSDFSVYHGHRNLVWTFVKNMPGFLLVVCLPLHLLLNIATVLFFTLRGQGLVILRAKRDALRGLPKMWRKRERIQKMRSSTVGNIWEVIGKGCKR